MTSVHRVGRALTLAFWIVATGSVSIAGVSGCKRTTTNSPTTEGSGGGPTARSGQGERPPPVPFEVRRDSTDLTFFWFDERGNAHGVSRVEDVPESRRANVRVDPNQPELRTPGWVYVADLRSADRHGRYPVRVVQSEQFASELAALNGLAQAMAAPVAPSPSTPPGTPAILAPQLAVPTDAGARQVRVIVYGASWCAACHQAANWLRAHNVPFIERDIEREPEAAQELMSRARAQGVPTSSIPIIDVNGRLLVGFNPEALEQALRGG